MPSSRCALAARNNADWCAAVWRAHGLVAEAGPGLVFCSAQTPRFYPNVVSVDPTCGAAEQVDMIARLSCDVPFEFSVKDSFGSLALNGSGFHLLFQASWIWSDPRPAGEERGELDWRPIERDRLADWEAAWRGEDPPGDRVFPDAVLDDGNVRFLGGLDARSRLVAGFIAYEAAGVVGITNAFGPERPPPGVIAGLTSPAPLVGYENGEALSGCLRQGFTAIGDLRIWARPALTRSS